MRLPRAFAVKFSGPNLTTARGWHHDMFCQRWLGSSLGYRGDRQGKERAAGSVAEDGDMSQ